MYCVQVVGTGHQTGNVCHLGELLFSGFWLQSSATQPTRPLSIEPGSKKARHKLRDIDESGHSYSEKMKPYSIATALLGLVSSSLADVAAGSPDTSSRTSKVILPTDFKPPQVFKNANLVHVISLEKNYAKEQINVLIENTDSAPQSEYYLPFTADQISRVGGFEVRDRKDTNVGHFATDVVEYDPNRYVFSFIEN